MVLDIPQQRVCEEGVKKYREGLRVSEEGERERERKREKVFLVGGCLQAGHNFWGLVFKSFCQKSGEGEPFSNVGPY